jgi:predicted dehydrogenase
MSNVWGIIGGGFGLYGYLPALVEIGVNRILVHEKYMPLIIARAELNRYFPNIELTKSYEEILNQAESLIFAVPPEVQEKYILEKISKNYKYLLLEKPLGTNPTSAKNVLRRGLEISGSMRIGYTFMYSQWAEKIARIMPLEEIFECKISWLFNSYHHRKTLKTWKSDHSCGGGALRFYGIQLIAFIAAVGKIKDVVESRLIFDKNNDAYEWGANLVMKNGARIAILLNSQSPKDQFRLLAKAGNKEFNAELDAPFDDEPRIGEQDIRTKALSNLLDSFLKDNSYDYYYLINQAWSNIESKTQYIYQ